MVRLDGKLARGSERNIESDPELLRGSGTGPNADTAAAPPNRCSTVAHSWKFCAALHKSLLALQVQTFCMA